MKTVQDYKMLFGQRVKSRREELHLSQTELARKLGYTNKATISCIESGKRSVPVTRAQDFADALDLPLEELIGWDTRNEHPQPAEQSDNTDRRNRLSAATKPADLILQQKTVPFAQPLSQVEQNLIDLFRNATDYGKGKAVADLENNQLPANKKTAK